MNQVQSILSCGYWSGFSASPMSLIYCLIVFLTFGLGTVPSLKPFFALLGTSLRCLILPLPCPLLPTVFSAQLSFNQKECQQGGSTNFENYIFLF